jgi:hypothetical protein
MVSAPVKGAKNGTFVGHGGHRRDAERGRRIAEQGDGALVVDQLLGVLARQLGVVLVVQGHQLDLAAPDAAGVVHLLEVRERAVADVVAQFGVAAGERRGLADDDVGREHRWRGSQQE